mgnify:FL=1
MKADVLNLTWDDVFKRLAKLKLRGKAIYGIPRGGAVVAGLAAAHHQAIPVQDPAKAQIILDDIIDSGRTREKHDPKIPFVALVDKLAEGLTGQWVVFPWEEVNEIDAEDIVIRQLEHLGEDPNRHGLIETPRRVIASWAELYAGYNVDNPEDVLKWFDDPTDEMVIARQIRFYSTCEHHLLPFYGYADIGYIPSGAVLGLSKIPRLVEVFARRLQSQEQLARQIGDTITNSTNHTPVGVAVSLRARHLCAMARGIKQQTMIFETNYLTGIFRESEARAEFLSGVIRDA